MAGELAARPRHESAAVVAARAELDDVLGASSLGPDLANVSSLLTSVASHADSAGCGNDVRQQVALVRARVHALFGQARAGLCSARNVAEAVLSGQAAVAADLSACRTRAGAAALRGNDALAAGLADRAANLASAIGDAADGAGDALARTLTARDGHLAAAEAARRKVERLHAQRAGAWHAHAALLQSMAECGRLYKAAADAEASARTKASMCGVLGFVRDIDKFLVARTGLPVLSPVAAYLDGVQTAADSARDDTAKLLAAKRRQRALSKEALDELAGCSRAIAEISSAAGAATAAADALKLAADELRRLAAVVLRVASFWTRLRNSAGGLSAKDYAGLLDRLAAGDGGGGAEGMKVWQPSAPVRRRHVQYYGRWAALADVCSTAVKDVDEAGRQAAEAIAKADKDAATAVAPTMPYRGNGADVIDLTNDYIGGKEAGASARVALEEAAQS